MFQLPEKLPLTFTNSIGKYRQLLSPNDHSLLTLVQDATEEDILFILNDLKNSHKKMSQLRPYERANVLKQVAQTIKTKQDFLAKIISAEGGKPIKDARTEVTRAADTIELCAEETLRLNGEVIPMERTPAGKDHIAFSIRESIGPVLAISAFNHPLNLIAHQVGTAIASGCAIVLKPASQTPLSAYFLHEAFKEAGLPAGTLKVLSAEVSLVEKLVASSHFDFVSFVGSAKVGWEIRKKIAKGTRLALEHGGQASAIVREDADLDLAIPALLRGSFYHAGQVCISTQGIFIHEKIYSNFVSRFREAALGLVVGSAMNENSDVGPLIGPAEVERLQIWIKQAELSGAKIILGNEVSGSSNQYLSPTILTNVPRGCTIMKEEAFGPVVCLNSYSDEEELLNYMNEKTYIFETALFTKDISRAMKIAKEIATMTFIINNHTAFRVDQMPFGGYKESGLGMGGVKYAMEELTRIKQIIIRM
jgi:acyl-CoA reductase-like NAD-dependent aldehyde dehydrogenase